MKTAISILLAAGILFLAIFLFTFLFNFVTSAFGLPPLSMMQGFALLVISRLLVSRHA